MDKVTEAVKGQKFEIIASNLSKEEETTYTPRLRKKSNRLKGERIR